MLPKELFTAAIEKILEDKSILKHPFYQKWTEGRLTLGELREYSKQYYIAQGPQNSFDVPAKRFCQGGVVDESAGAATFPLLQMAPKPAYAELRHLFVVEITDQR